MSKTDGPAPAWQQNRLFQFFASLQLAMLLLGVLIVASVAGTIYESSLDAKVARAYIYGAPWFNFWLLLLALNLIASALSRMPWKKRHTGFLITHLGIILVLLGSYIGRTWGIEGTMILFKNEPPSNLLTVDERVLQIVENENSARVLPLEFIHHKPDSAHPHPLVVTASGWDMQAIDYSSALEVKTEAQAVEKEGAPAVHVSISTAMMGQKLDSWLLADDAHATLDLGLASITFKQGQAPNAAAPASMSEAVEIEESIFAFANSPADQVAKSLKGGSTGAKVKLVDVAGDHGKVVVVLNGAEQTFEVKPNLHQSVAIPNSQLNLTIEQYWPDFRVKDGKPVSISDEPNNPCLLVTISGRGVPVATPTDDNGRNFVTLFTDSNGALTYQLSSRKAGVSTGKLELNKPLVTGWADWQLVVDQALPHAVDHFVARPAPNGKIDGVLVRATRAGQSLQQWVPLGWQIAIPTLPKPIQVGYGLRQKALPISLRLTDFQVDRNEGTDAPAGFKSTLEITGIDGGTATGQCWMNNPISFPASWIHTFSGLTYKISQASWNPENLSQSTVQILRDPGWCLKWTGSLLVVAGIFSLFYLRPYPTDLQPIEKVGTKDQMLPRPSRHPAEVS